MYRSQVFSARWLIGKNLTSKLGLSTRPMINLKHFSRLGANACFSRHTALYVLLCCSHASISHWWCILSWRVHRAHVMALLLQLRLGCRGREARRWNSYARNHAPMLLTFVFIASLCLRMIQNCFHCWNPGWTVNPICLPLFPNDRRALSLMSARFPVRPCTVQTKNLSHRNHLYGTVEKYLTRTS